MQKKLKIAVTVVFIAVTVAITVLAARWVFSLSDTAKLLAFQNWVGSLGIGGWILLFAIQYIQIVIAFIPGGPIQVVAGALFGPWGGLAICFGGMILATATVFYLVSRFGQRVISLFVEEKDISEYKFLNDEKQLEKLVLLLFFIPGTPKDALTYIFALSKIKMRRFMLLSMLARTPAMVTSLLAGSSVIEGNWTRAVIMFITLTALSVAGYFMQRFLRLRVNARCESDK